jgi:hypothetical protein
MLSVVDLIGRGTLTPELAARLMTRVRDGSSWLVGARPGGAGKTAVMCALLAVLPEGERVMLTNPETGWKEARAGECIVSYELGGGRYDAYIWGQDLRHFAALGSRGVRIVSNLHADTLEEARTQIVTENGVPENHLRAFDMFIPVKVSGGWTGRKRLVERVDYFEDGEWRVTDGRPAHDDREENTAAFLKDCLERGVRTVEDVRAAITGLRNPSSAGNA